MSEPYRLPLRCGRCGSGVLAPPPRHVFDHFCGENVASLLRHFAEHYARMLLASHQYDEAQLCWQNEGGQ